MENQTPLSKTPVFPSTVYENLPPFIKQLIDQFGDSREKDVVLTSILAILSGCFDKIEGVYGNDWVSPNLYGFIVAPPASGKGVMKYAQLLGKTIQERLLKANEEAKTQYDLQLKIWTKRSKKDAKALGNAPKKPKYPVLFIPGNSSSTAIYKRLYENNGTGIICETEADTLSVAISQDWGNFSDLLRKAFHHDVLSINRSGEDLLMYIDKPRLSVLLTGTPDQVPKLIGSVHNGLCSRFLFYCYSQGIIWKDPTPCVDCTDLEEVFQHASNRVDEIVSQLSKEEYSFALSEEQFGQLSDSFRQKLKAIELFEGQDAASAVVRLGIICFRMAMVLSVISQIDSTDKGRKIICTDTDFKTALALTDIYYAHAMIIYSLLPKHSRSEMSSQSRQFYLALPSNEKFSRKKANEIGNELGIKERTIGNFLEKLVDAGYLSKPEFGSYLKEAA